METAFSQELTVWRRLSAAYSGVRDQLDRDLAGRADLSLAEFEVLRTLADAGRPLRMSKLAELTHTSRSGLTRRVDRLEERGLIVREPVDGDRRGLRAGLTDEGLAACDELTPAYLTSLQGYLEERLRPEEMSSIAVLLARFG